MSIDLKNPIISNIVYHKKDMAWHAINGNCKMYKASSKEYAKLAVDNFEVAKKVPEIKITGHLPFQKKLNLLKIMLFDLFRKMSPEEKQLHQLVKKSQSKSFVG